MNFFMGLISETTAIADEDDDLWFRMLFQLGPIYSSTTRKLDWIIFVLTKAHK